MSKVLVKWESNWADEMDVEGFVIMEASEWAEKRERISQVEGSTSICVGTNEDVEYDRGADILDEITEHPLTDTEEEVIVKLFGKSSEHNNFIDSTLYNR